MTKSSLRSHGIVIFFRYAVDNSKNHKAPLGAFITGGSYGYFKCRAIALQADRIIAIENGKITRDEVICP